MTPLDLTDEFIAEMARDRLETARRARLARLTRCCHPTAWRLATRRVLAWSREQLRPAGRAPASCCT